MKNTKGFTLIELLAVIAILAIILLIAVPMVLSTISTSRDNALKSSASMIWAAAENCVAMNTITAANCAIPTTHATSAGFSNESTLPGLAANWIALSSTNFSGTYRVVWGANNTTVVGVYVTNAVVADIDSQATQRYIYIDAKNDTTPTFTN